MRGKALMSNKNLRYRVENKEGRGRDRRQKEIFSGGEKGVGGIFFSVKAVC